MTKEEEEKLPRGDRPLLLGKWHADLLPLGLINGFWLRPDSMFLAGTCARRRSLVQRRSIDHVFIRNTW
jgi:hypothetical protein